MTAPRSCTGPGDCDRPHKGHDLCNAHLNQYHARGKDRTRLTPIGAPRRTKGCDVADCTERHYRAGRCAAHYEASLQRNRAPQPRPTVRKTGNPGESYIRSLRPPADDEQQRARACLNRHNALDVAPMLGL